MPAAERQLVNALRSVLHTRNIWKVAVVSTEGDEKTYEGVKEALGGGAVVVSNHGLESIQELSGFDALIVNKILGKKIEDHAALDAFVKATLKALKPGGVLIFREDLSSSNDGKLVARLTNYLDVFRVEEDGQNTGFEFYATEEVEDSIHRSLNWHDYFWTLVKKSFPVTAGGNVTFRDFLDKTQYTDEGIGAYEWIFGENFISPGGWDQNLAIIKRFGNMLTGQKMLDIGVGIGGGARQVASEFGVHVHGIDLSSNMLAVALDRVHKEKDTRVTYAICDALVYKFEPASYDYVFSRDCIQHIEDTGALFRGIYNALKPGGKVLITMYGVGYGELSEKFKAYVAQRQYYLKNLKQIEEIAKQVGFVNVVTENMTPRFKEILHEERSRVEDNKEEFLTKFTQKEYDSLVTGWASKLQYIADDNHNWNLFLAQKPL